MSLLFDLIYLCVLAILSPWLLWRAWTTGRYRHDLRAKLFGCDAVPNPDGKPVVWFHGVSVGEIHLLGVIVAAFRKQHPDWLVVISSTTDTGVSEARKRFADLPVIAFPFDFSWAVKRTITSVQPALIVLAESELWPNLLAVAETRRVPVVVANMRMSPRSFARLQRIRSVANRFLLGKVSAFGVQAREYAERLRQLGVTEHQLEVTGSVKYDGATGDRTNPKIAELRRLIGLTNQPVWVVGSTHAPEETIAIEVFTRLRARFQQLRLLIVPRHPDRFAEVAQLIEQSQLPFAKRSTIHAPLAEMPEVVLLDTLGELGAAWGLADVAFTGGSLDGKRGGQSMIEPAGYGVPLVYGPHIWNFRDTGSQLVDAGAAVIVRDADDLEREVARLLDDPQLRITRGTAARELVRQQQGATLRTVELLDRVLAESARRTQVVRQ